MSRYVDADALIKALDELHKPHDIGFGEESVLVSINLKALINFIKEQSTIDVVEVVHGEWIYNKTSALWECSNCHEEEIRSTTYCPHCGARNGGGR